MKKNNKSLIYTDINYMNSQKNNIKYSVFSFVFYFEASSSGLQPSQGK